MQTVKYDHLLNFSYVSQMIQQKILGQARREIQWKVRANISMKRSVPWIQFKARST